MRDVKEHQNKKLNEFKPLQTCTYRFFFAELLCQLLGVFLSILRSLLHRILGIIRCLFGLSFHALRRGQMVQFGRGLGLATGGGGHNC